MSASRIVVDVVYALPRRQVIRKLALPEGSTLADAIRASGLAGEYPEIASARAGIYGKTVPAGTALRDRDRVEIYRPLRADPNASEVLVRTEVIRQGQPPVQIDYGMEKKDGAWKAYDVVVGGVSLVTNYRDEFTEQVRAGGIDGLMKTLATKNGGGAK